MWSTDKKKEKDKQINDLTSKQKCLERRHMMGNDAGVLKQIQQTLNHIYENESEARAKFFKMVLNLKKKY